MNPIFKFTGPTKLPIEFAIGSGLILEESFSRD